MIRATPAAAARARGAGAAAAATRGLAGPARARGDSARGGADRCRPDRACGHRRSGSERCGRRHEFGIHGGGRPQVHLAAAGPRAGARPAREGRALVGGCVEGDVLAAVEFGFAGARAGDPGDVLLTDPVPVPERVTASVCPGPAGPKAKSAPCSEAGGPSGRGRPSSSCCRWSRRSAVGRGRGFVDREPDRHGVDDGVFELATVEARGVELVDHGERVFEAGLGVVGDEEVAGARVDRQAGVLERDEAPGGGAGAVDFLNRRGEADFRVIDLDPVVGGVGDVDQPAVPGKEETATP